MNPLNVEQNLAAIKRLQKVHHDVPVTLQASAQSFTDVTTERLSTVENTQ